MTMTATRSVPRHRPVLVSAAIGLLTFLGISATAGGIALIFGTEAAGILPPGEWLTAIPLVDSWLLPGLVLGIGFGLGALVTAFGMLRRPHWQWARFVEDWSGHHWSWLATMILGVGHVVWIGLELVYLPELSILQAVYGPIGVALMLLPLMSQVSEHLALN